MSYQGNSPDKDPQAVETLSKLKVSPCRFKVEADEPVPDYVVEHWKGKGIEVEPIGIIRVKFNPSGKEYVYPYGVKGGD